MIKKLKIKSTKYIWAIIKAKYVHNYFEHNGIKIKNNKPFQSFHNIYWSIETIKNDKRLPKLVKETAIKLFKEMELNRNE